MKKNLLSTFKNQLRGITALILLACVSVQTLLAEKVDAQSVFNVSISIDENEVELKELFNKVESQTKYRFTYNSKSINLTEVVAVSEKYKSLGALLEDVADQTKLKFRQINYSLVVSRVGNEGSGKEEQSGKLIGKILDENGLPLPGATVMIADLENVGAVTNSEGEFVLSNVPAGDHQIAVSYIGYQPSEQTVRAEAGKTVAMNVSIKPGVLMGDEVMIIGDRLKGQAKALNKQRTNQNITNVVAADQIGRFPDANIGDAVKRIPGITVQNDQGEARNIIIRGLAPELNSVTLNGERIPSAEGDNRRVQMDLIPADMIQTIEVSKAVTPDMDADAIGGSVNLVTRSAPEALRISGTAASGYNFLSEKPIWTGGLVVGDRILNNKLGVIVSGSYNVHDFGSDNVEAAWAEGDNGAYIEEFEIREYLVKRVRRSLSAALDYEINPNHKLFLRGMYNHRDDWENRYRLSYRDIAEPDENGVVFVESIRRQTKGGIGGGRTDNARLEDQRVRNVSLGGDHFLGNVKLSWATTYARASEERPNERYAQYEAQPEVEIDGEDEPQGMLFIQNLSDPRKPFMQPTNGNGFSLGGNDPSLVNGSIFELDELTEENQLTEETDWNTRLDLQLPISDRAFIKFGGKLRMKEKIRDNDYTEYSFLNDEFETLDVTPNADYSDPDYLAGENYQVGIFATEGWLGSLNFNDTQRFEGEDLPDEYLPSNYTATEDIIAAYAMIDQQIGDKLSVLAGMRMERTDIEYTGNELVLDVEGDIAGTRSVSDQDSYTNLLPGVHVKYDINDYSVLRFAWTNTIARPNYFQLVPFREVNFEDNELLVGNPELSPTVSMNFDIMAEHYFKSIGLLSAGVFYKDIDDFIYTNQTQDFVDPISGNTFETLFRPENGGNAELYGFELAAQRQLDFLPGVWRGLGIYANYTYNHSSTEGVTNEDGDLRNGLDLPGTADHLFNASLSFENEKLVIRVSLNYSSDYIDEVGGDAFSDRYYDEQLFVDLNGSYAFTPQLRFFFEANNLTNQPLRYYQGTQDRTMQMEYYNARFNAGLKFDLIKN
ncbi:TonB-dependent receptor [Fulvivirga lutea]|uniref:TonB-dependent receptor n=1 Tax=Fulvivirga lutea TaxID=2810512 RepID=A0A974ZZI8_9BACT|nr:TonB-dependent receptor [Fulvivirga lutea]QSE96171.1 TonB-dependent receptor [Fulvivirga lutea]